jgi:dTDP-4-amino-4,6-dideoxygalactose transaminase
MISKTRKISAQAREAVPYYLHKEIGYNYRLSNVLAGIGRGQMEVLPKRVEKRREIFEFYKNELGSIKGIYFPEEPAGFFSNRWLTTVLFSKDVWKSGTNEELRISLEKLNIETRALWKPLHQQPVFEACTAYNNGVSDELYETGLCLPSGSNTTRESLNLVVSEIKKCLV